jgi:hypothetical protein
VNRLLLGILAAGVIIVGVIYVPGFLRRPNVDRLIEVALSESEAADRIEAARDLCQLGDSAGGGIRTVLCDSNDENVVAICILGVARQMDYQSMDNLIDRLDDPSATVRTAAAKAIARLLGRDHHFPALGSASQRAEIKDKIVKDWKSYNGSPLFEFNKERFKKQGQGEGL